MKTPQSPSGRTIQLKRKTKTRIRNQHENNLKISHLNWIVLWILIGTQPKQKSFNKATWCFTIRLPTPHRPIQRKEIWNELHIMKRFVLRFNLYDCRSTGQRRIIDRFCTLGFMRNAEVKLPQLCDSFDPPVQLAPQGSMLPPEIRCSVHVPKRHYAINDMVPMEKPGFKRIICLGLVYMWWYPSEDSVTPISQLQCI